MQKANVGSERNCGVEKRYVAAGVELWGKIGKDKRTEVRTCVDWGTRKIWESSGVQVMSLMIMKVCR